MVIPLPPMPTVDGPPPAECQEDLQRMKWSIIAMMVCGAGRAFFAIVQGAISIDLFALVFLFLTIVMGTFLFKDDEHLQPFYNCLVTTICSSCADGRQGGMACLMPFLSCTAINCLMDLIMRFQFFQFPPYGIFLASSLVAQAVACFFGYRVFKTMRSLAEGGGYELSGSRPAPGAWDRNDAPARQDFQDGTAAQAAGHSASSFLPFAGQGQRLGS